LKIKEIEAVNFTKRLPVAKEIINVQKDLDSKNLGQDFLFYLKIKLHHFYFRCRKWSGLHRI
jgi:hypothetical protein